MVVQVYVQRIVESGCWGQLSSRGAYSIHQAGHFQRGDPGPCCAGFGPPAMAVGWDGLSGLRLWLVSGWSVSFSVERQLQRGKWAPC